MGEELRVELNGGVTISLKEVAEVIGNDYILDTEVEQEKSRKAYLAALAVETIGDDSYDTKRIIREFVNNCHGPSSEERERIIELLEEVDW